MRSCRKIPHLDRRSVNLTMKQLPLTRFAGVTLADIAKDFPAVIQEYGQRCE